MVGELGEDVEEIGRGNGWIGEDERWGDNGDR